MRARRKGLRVRLFDQGVPIVLALYIGVFALAGIVYAFVRGPLERRGPFGQYGAIVISGLPAMLIIGRIVAHERGQEWLGFPTALESAFAVVGAFLFGAAWYAGTHHKFGKT